MHFVTTLFHPFDDLNPTWTIESYQQGEIIIDPPPYDERVNNDHRDDNENPALDQDHANGDQPPSPPPSSTAVTPVDVLTAIPETEIVQHAPGWTVFKNLYMSNGTFYVVSDKPRSEFPELLYILSVPIPALNTPENIQARLPTEQEMDFIGVDDALLRWGPVHLGEKNRIWPITGNTVSESPPRELHQSLSPLHVASRFLSQHHPFYFAGRGLSSVLLITAPYCVFPTVVFQ